MKRDALGNRDPGRRRVPFEDLLDARVVEANPLPPRLVGQPEEERGGRGRGAHREPGQEGFAGIGGDREDLLLVPLPQHHERGPFGIREVHHPLDVEPDHLADPEAHEPQLGHRPVPNDPGDAPLKRGAELRHLVLCPPAMDPVRTARRAQILGDRKRAPLAPPEPLVELAEGGDAARAGGDGEPGLGHPAREPDEVFGRGALEVAGNVLGKVFEVAHIGEAGVHPMVLSLEVGPPLEEQWVIRWNRRTQAPPSWHDGPPPTKCDDPWCGPAASQPRE